jgi:serine protease
MLRRGFLKLTGAFAGAGATSSVVTATPGRKPGPKKAEILVGVSPMASDMKGAVEQHVPGNAKVVHENQSLGYVAVKFPKQANEKAKDNFIDAITKKDHIRYAERNETLKAEFMPSDADYDTQYAPQQINAPSAWDTTLGSESVSIAVVDTGTQYSHPDLSGGYDSYKGKDFADDDSDPAPDVPSDEYHGTHVSGIAGARTDNRDGVAGISNCTLLSGRALDESGGGSLSDIADAIQWAADQGADVLNMSLGGGGYRQTMKDAVSYAYDNGVFIVAATGNDSASSVSYPAAYDECLAVGAVDSNEQLASFSNTGDKVELVAPGVDVLSTTTDARGNYETLSGTSMATPVVAGAAGVTLSQWDLSNTELRAHLKDTAKDLGLASSEQGAGQVDLAAAVNTDPSGDGGGGGGGGGGDDGGDGGDGGSGGSTSASVNDSLSSYWDSDCWTYAFEYSSPSKIVLELEGPTRADFDLYANDGSTACPEYGSADYSSYTGDSQEKITIENPDTSTDLRAAVDSYSGSGEYTLTITEYE